MTACGIDKNIKKGEKYLALGEYYDAADQFKQAYTKTPTKEREKRGQRALKMAYCYERSTLHLKQWQPIEMLSDMDKLISKIA